jgi:hypothetical protein
MSTDRSDHAAAPPRPQPMAEMRPSRLQAHATESGVAGGAAAAKKELDTQPVKKSSPPAPEPPAAAPKDPSAAPIRLTKVRGATPQSTEALAEDDALLAARDRLVEAFEAQNPPITHKPTVEEVRRRYLKPGSAKVVDPNTIDPEVRNTWKRAKPDHETWVEVDVEVSHDQLRDLRSDDRLGAAGGLAAAAFVVLAALYGFLRVDAWTKGYLTGGLALAAAAAAGGGVALLVLMR